MSERMDDFLLYVDIGKSVAHGCLVRIFVLPILAPLSLVGWLWCRWNDWRIK